MSKQRRWDSHRHTAMLEDEDFLLAQGFCREMVARRLGTTVGNLDKLRERRAREQGNVDTGTLSGAGEGS